MGLKFLVFVFCLTNSYLDAATIHSREKRAKFQVDSFLEDFGYMDQLGDTGGGHDASDRERAVSEFQKMVGLPVTGELNKATVKKMKSPRCGFRDVLRPSERPGEINKDPKKVQLTPLSNGMRNINGKTTKVTWKIMGYTRQLGGTSQRRSYINAFKKWSDVANLNIQEVGSGHADILIKYARGDHFDGSPFDGRGRVLAHAFFPGTGDISGDTHFDDDEQWTLGTKEGTNLEIVAAHEFGHALGLGHSTDRNALMAPYYKGYDANYKLGSDDIYRMRRLYGQRVATRTTRAPRPTSRPRPTTKPKKPSLCDLKFDAVFLNPRDRRVYILRQRKLYRLEADRNGIEKGYTKVSRKYLTPRVPTNPGAAVHDGRHLYIFKGRKLFRYTNFRLDHGYPKRINVPFFQRVQAAIFYRNAIFVFNGDEFSFWHESYRNLPDRYPRKIKQYWGGLRDNLEAAVTLDRYAYFFKGSKYFKVDVALKRLMYRKDKANAWLGCGNQYPH